MTVFETLKVTLTFVGFVILMLTLAYLLYNKIAKLTKIFTNNDCSHHGEKPHPGFLEWLVV